MASVFSNSLRLIRTSKLRVLDWITYAIIKRRLGLTSTKDWLIACMLVRVEQKLLESERWCLYHLLEAHVTWGIGTWTPWLWCRGLVNQTSFWLWHVIQSGMRSRVSYTLDKHHRIVHILRAKLEELKHMLIKKDILRKVRAHVYVVEFQKAVYHTHIFC